MLTELRCRAAKKASKPYKLADEKGLYLYVTTSGFRSWRWKYRFDGKEKRLTFGGYPEVSLKEARDLRDDARRALRSGVDPAEARKRPAGDADNTIEAVARRWHGKQKGLWTKKHAELVLASLVKEVFPTLGKKQVGAVTARDVRDLLAPIQERGAIEAAHRIQQRLSAVFDFAIGESLIDINPAAGRQKALIPIRYVRQPALLQLDRARAFLKAVEALPAHPLTKLASRLLALTAVRPGVVRFTPREGEFEQLGAREPFWRIPAERMKLLAGEKEDEAFEFLVPLSRQAAETVAVAASFAAPSKWLFPSQRSWRRPMSENALSYFYKRAVEFQGKHVPHGWRSTFSTIMNERAIANERPEDRAIIDLMLAHKPQGVEAIYNRAAYMPRRRELAQEWADLLLKGMPPAEQLLEGPRR